MELAFRRVSRWMASALIAAALLILVGWQFHIGPVKGAYFGTFIAPNTALCFGLCGISALLQLSSRRFLMRMGQVVAALILLFGAAIFSEWTFRLDFGIDKIFFAHRLSDWNLPFPGRFSFNSAIGFCLGGIGLLALRSRSRVPVSEVAAGLILLLSYLSLLGYLYAIPMLYSAGNVMALPTAILFAVLAATLLAAGPRQVMGIALSPYAGGIVSRRIITAIVIIMPLMGWIEIQGRSRSMVSGEFGIALLVLAIVLVFTLLTLRTAIAVNHLDRKRLEVESALRISERHLANSLAEANLNLRRLQMIEETVDAGTWEFDVATGVSHWGPGISSLWGLPARDHELSLQEFTERIYHEDRERVSAVVQHALQSGDSYDVEFRVVWPDQSIHWLAARGVVISDEKRRPIRIIGIALEITQRHQTEKALRDSEKLAATGRLAATIAHEINNPLEAVVNLVYLAKNAHSLDPSTRELLQAADTELARVSHMVRQTLGFYRETSSPVWIDLTSTVEQIISLYRNKIQRKAIDIKVRTSPARIFGMEGELRQVISNFISNALDAVEMNGRISVRVRTVGRGIRILVADDGHGIAPEHRAKVFQPFFTTKKDFGTGLGLWVSKGIIDKHQGKVRMRSRTRPGASGTVFNIDLPIEASAPPPQVSSMKASRM
jgi:PAS domain S-box-containing protein